jgi:hypothetical protein
MRQTTVGQYLAKRLEEIGLQDYFAVPRGAGAEAPQVLAREIRTEAELVAALEAAEGFPGLVFLEVMLDKYDCNKVLLGWGSAVADFNAGKGTQCRMGGLPMDDGNGYGPIFG